MNCNFRIGSGFDIHPLVEGIQLILGGIEIPFDRGSKGHSDGDVLLHAIVDALLGAANLGDIGEHFPETELSLKGIASTEILKKVVLLLAQNKWVIVNIDSNIILEKPKLKGYKKEMAIKIAEIVQISEQNISIKAKTMEKMGEVGQGKAIMAFANVLLKKSEKNKTGHA